MPATLKDVLFQIDDLKGQIDAMRPLSADQKGRIFDKFRLDWNYHSNAIEGNTLTHGETKVFLLEGLTAQGKPLKDHLDIRGHNEVIDFLFSFIQRKSELSEAAIREMHKILLVETYKAESITPDGKPSEKWIKLGEYKDTPNQVTTGTGKIRRFALPQDTPAKMGELMKWFRDESASRTLHPTLVASFFHHQFVHIHPFDDGNGRMARILMNLLLMQHGYPPVVIKVEERQRYFAALARADEGERNDFDLLICEKLLTSLELFLKGAKGEPIEEDDDIDKKIALLKRQLEHIPEPQTFSPEVYETFLQRSFLPLAAKVYPKMGKFDDLFLESRASLILGNHHYDVSGPPGERLTATAKVAIAGDRSRDLLRLSFNYFTFKRSGVNSFDYSTEGIEIHFEKLAYTVTWNRPGKIFKKPYGVDLSEEECVQIAKDMAEDCLKHIQQSLEKRKVG